MKALIILVLALLIIVSNAFAQIDTIVWVQESSIPDSIQRDIPGYFLVDSDFFVAGGESAGGNCASTVWKYHIPTDTWMQMGNLPFGGAACGGSFVLNGKGYFLTASDSVRNDNCDTMFWEYDPSIDIWTKKANFPDKPRQNSSSFSYGGKGYIGFTGGCISVDNHLWQYDPILNTWSAMTALPDAIASGRAVATALPDAAYTICGLNIFGAFINDIWRYNIDSNSWDSLGQMPGSPRAYPIMWGFDSMLMGGGGTDGATLYNDFYRYTIANNIWTPVVFQNSFDSTSWGATFIFNNKGYYFGGSNRINPDYSFSNNMWSFDASKFFPDSTVGIAEIKPDLNFKVYSNPASHESGFSISTSESGSVLFYDALGRVLDERKLVHGLNQIKLTVDNEVIFYRATLQDGATENGKIVFIK